MDSEENATSCSVCREIYSDPRSLACGHSFCLKCLKRVAGNNKRFPCPICRRYIDLRGTNVDQLPKNFVLCNVIEAREKKHPSMCLDHNKSLDLFCQGCDEVICSKCMSMQHKGHAIEDIEIIYIERNKQYGEFLERTKHFTSMIEEQRYDVQQSRILMEKNIDSIRNRVDNTFKKWNDALQKQHDAICSYLHQEREWKKQMFVEAERILAGSMTTVTRLDTEINKLRSKGPAFVVQQYGSMKARQEDTERKILQDIQTCSTPPDNLVLEVYAPWIEEAINNIKHIDMKQTQARPGRQKIAEIQEENVILKRECEKLQNTVQKLKKRKTNEVKNLEYLNQCLDSLVQCLHDHVVFGAKISPRTLEQPAEIDPESSIAKWYQHAREICAQYTKVKKEVEYVACLLEDLAKVSQSSNNGDNSIILSHPDNCGTSWGYKTKDAKNTESSRNKPMKSVQNEKLMRHYGNASYVLKQMKENENLRIDLGKRTEEVKDLMVRCKKLQEENNEIKNDADSQRTRLSEHAGALLTFENPSIYDLSDPNRPTKLSEMYSELYDSKWTDAYVNLEKEDPDISEKKIVGYLYDMLVDGYRFCEDVRRKQILALENILFDPAGGMKTSQRGQKEKISTIFAKHLSDVAKLSSNVSSVHMAEAFVMDEKTKDKYRKMIKLCETYIKECVQLCWLMQVQTPPLCLDLKTIQGEAFDKNCYSEYTKKGKKIAFVVWPALFIHENGPLLSRGFAQCQ